MSASPVLEVVKIGHAYGEDSVLSSVSFSLHEKTILCVVGPSGCGKTTLLRIIAGLVPPKMGDVLINGQNASQTPTNERDLGFVFQEEGALFPHLSVRQNVEFPFRHGRRTLPEGQDWREAVNQIMADTQLVPHEKHMIHQLSGGLKQRVAIARAMVYQPSLLLLDEPLSSLDNKKKTSLIELIRQLRTSTRTAFLYVTHDDREVRALADEVIVMEGGIVHQEGQLSHVLMNPSELTADLFQLNLNRKESS